MQYVLSLQTTRKSFQISIALVITMNKRQEWIVWGEHEYTEAGNRRRASCTMVIEWAFDVWRKVATDDLMYEASVSVDTSARTAIQVHFIQNYTQQSRVERYLLR